jgi:hypothetical protein
VLSYPAAFHVVLCGQEREVKMSFMQIIHRMCIGLVMSLMIVSLAMAASGPGSGGGGNSGSGSGGGVEVAV